MNSIVSELLHARATFSSHRNRRRLFSRFDEVFANYTEENGAASVSLSATQAHSRRRCEFKRLRFENWKAFECAELTFPPADDGRPIILIGGNNGNGKTSILDGIIACLYGVQSFLEGSRGTIDGSETQRRAEYRQFIERAVHRPAYERGARMSSIVVEILADGEVFEVERRWYFDGDGRMYEEDEELVIRCGLDRHIVQIPADEDAASFYGDLIGSTLSPASMIPFFLFDGERVTELSKREIGDQVRFGIESALGISSLKRLIVDLNDYVKDRGRDVLEDEVDAGLKASIEALEVSRREASSELAALIEVITPLREARDEAVHNMGSMAGGSFHDRRESLEAKHAAENQLVAVRSEIAVASGKLLPYLLLGPSIVKATKRSLTSAATVSQNMIPEETLLRLLNSLQALSPKLDESSELEMVGRVKEAWSMANQTTSDGPRKHVYLDGHRVDRVLDAFDHSLNDARMVLPALLKRAAELKASIARFESLLNSEARNESAREAIASSLTDLNDQIDRKEHARRELEQRVWKLEMDLAPKLEERQRRQSQRRGTAAGIPAVEAADEIRSAILHEIETAIPSYYGRLAERLTEIYKKLAHKSVIDRISISGTGTVSLYDGSGRDLTSTDSSAGENQIFATSLIAAVSSLLGAPLPLVVDTPLGRLDTGHRERILDFFMTNPNQTIILSQPEEVGGRYYEQIYGSVGAEYHLSYRANQGGLGHTVLELGYFEREAA